MARSTLAGCLLIALAVFLTGAMPHRRASASALPPTVVVLSGETARGGELSTIVARAGGVFTSSELAGLVMSVPLEMDALYLLDPDTGAIVPAESETSVLGFGGNALSMYSPSIGVFQQGFVVDPTEPLSLRQVDWSLGDATTLGESLAETGSFAIIGPNVFSVPEPVVALSMWVGGTALAGLARSRRRRGRSPQPDTRCRPLANQRSARSAL